MTDILIAAASTFNGTGLAGKELKARLKTEYGYDGRRLSRLSLHALLAALPLRAQLPADCAVITASSFSSPALFTTMMDNVFSEGGLAKPFDFLGNLHNAPAFACAHALQLTGATEHLFLPENSDSWQQPLALAAGHVQHGFEPAVLTVIAHEAAAGEPEGAAAFLITGTGSVLPDAAGNTAFECACTAAAGW